MLILRPYGLQNYKCYAIDESYIYDKDNSLIELVDNEVIYDIPYLHNLYKPTSIEFTENK
jgi:hypothetical protein